MDFLGLRVLVVEQQCHMSSLAFGQVGVLLRHSYLGRSFFDSFMSHAEEVFIKKVIYPRSIEQDSAAQDSIILSP
jgi:hypothetical protein